MLLDIFGFEGVVLGFFDILALFGGHQQSSEESDEKQDRDAKAAFKAEVAAVKNCTDV